MGALFKLIRIKHWVKNTFLFIPLFFAGEIGSTERIIDLIQGFLCFSFTASAIYIINDLRDLEQDKLHPIKKLRPLASGAISKNTARVIVFVFLSAIIWAYFLQYQFFFLLLTYFIINLLYSFGMKNISIVDLFMVASGFLIRVLSGGVLAQVPITQWLLVMISLLALFLVLAKRRDDILLYHKNGKTIRKASSNYTLEYVNVCMTMLSAVMIVAYIMYSISDDVMNRLGSENVYITAVFVVAGLMRYMQIAIVEGDSGSPTKILFRDKFIITTLILWALTFYLIIYF